MYRRLERGKRSEKTQRNHCFNAKFLCTKTKTNPSPDCRTNQYQSHRDTYWRLGSSIHRRGGRLRVRRNRLCIFLPNFTVSSTSLNTTGLQSRNICETTVISPSTPSKRTCQKRWSLYSSAPFESGNIECTGMDAYRSGLGTTDAQKQVRKFSSTKYKSHRCIPERVARAMDP